MMNPVQNRWFVLLGLLGLILSTPTWGQEVDAVSTNVRRNRRLIPEETFVIGREAVIRSAGESGAWIIIFENGGGQGELPAMFLMPSRRLQRLETALEMKKEVANGEFELRALVSGQVFAYQNYNFLMLTAMPRLQAPAEDEDEEASEVEDGTEDESAAADGEGGDDGEESEGVGNASADVESMIKDLESEGPMAPIFQRPAVDSTARGNGTTPRAGKYGETGAANRNALVEGAFVMNRAARLVHTIDTGAWAIVFESDDDGLSDEPLIVQPCKMLEQMEARAEQLGDAFKLNISGQVFTYRGGVYLLPTLMQLPYERDNLSP